MKENRFVLVWLSGGKAQPVIQGAVQICQKRKSEIKDLPQYKRGKLILRTLNGYLSNPNWQPKTNK